MFAMGYSQVIIVTVLNLISFKLGNAIQVDPEVNPLVHGDFPWVLKLIKYHNNGRVGYCGASLISNKYALTAAHCAINLANPITST